MYRERSARHNCCHCEDYEGEQLSFVSESALPEACQEGPCMGFPMGPGVCGAEPVTPSSRPHSGTGDSGIPTTGVLRQPLPRVCPPRGACGRWCRPRPKVPVGFPRGWAELGVGPGRARGGGAVGQLLSSPHIPAVS